MPVQSINDKYKFVKKYEEIQNIISSLKALAESFEIKKQELKSLSDYSTGLSENEKSRIDMPLADMIKPEGKK